MLKQRQHSGSSGYGGALVLDGLSVRHQNHLLFLTQKIPEEKGIARAEDAGAGGQESRRRPSWLIGQDSRPLYLGSL